LQINWSRDGESGEIRIANMGEHIESFEFADGSVLGSIHADKFVGGRDSLAGTSSDDLIIGTANDDFIYGGAGDDILDAGAGTGGWQYLYGQGGDDTYLYGTESGSVFLSASAESATTGTADRVILTDLALSDVTFSTYDYTQGGTVDSSAGVALQINWSRDGESGEIRIANMGEHIESFEFADGSVLTDIVDYLDQLDLPEYGSTPLEDALSKLEQNGEYAELGIERDDLWFLNTDMNEQMYDIVFENSEAGSKISATNEDLGLDSQDIELSQPDNSLTLALLNEAASLYPEFDMFSDMNADFAIMLDDDLIGDDVFM